MRQPAHPNPSRNASYYRHVQPLFADDADLWLRRLYETLPPDQSRDPAEDEAGAKRAGTGQGPGASHEDERRSE